MNLTTLFLTGSLLLTAAGTAQTIVRFFEGDSGRRLATCESGVTHCDRPETSVSAASTDISILRWTHKHSDPPNTGSQAVQKKP